MVRTIMESRIHNRLPIAREGFPFILAALGITICFIWLDLTVLSILFGVLFLFVLYFFRDPERIHVNSEKGVLTPADGKIIEVKKLKEDMSPLGRPSIKISIFMSVFNVHVNRIPIRGTIKDTAYHPGKFLSANLDKASEQNESNRIIIETGDSREIMVIQIAGLIARRIVCWVGKGDRVQTGQRFGLIRFGSRLEVFLPAESRIVAKTGHKVKAGETIIGYMP